MKVKILEAVGHVKGTPLKVGTTMEVDKATADKMLAAGVAEKA